MQAVLQMPIWFLYQAEPREHLSLNRQTFAWFLFNQFCTQKMSDSMEIEEFKDPKWNIGQKTLAKNTSIFQSNPISDET